MGYLYRPKPKDLADPAGGEAAHGDVPELYPLKLLPKIPREALLEAQRFRYRRLADGVVARRSPRRWSAGSEGPSAPP